MRVEAGQNENCSLRTHPAALVQDKMTKPTTQGNSYCTDLGNALLTQRQLWHAYALSPIKAEQKGRREVDMPRARVKAREGLATLVYSHASMSAAINYVCTIDDQSRKSKGAHVKRRRLEGSQKERKGRTMWK